MPDLSLETAAGGLVAGIDEAGRGPLAGPVVAAAVVLDPERLDPYLAHAIHDSKKLPADRRRAVHGMLRACAAIGVGQASVDEIDEMNILQATLLAMTRAVAALDLRPNVALVDGNYVPNLPCPTHAIVRGDTRSLSIAAASIVAKVTRDRIMADLATTCPGYGWERNAGYGTAEHKAALLARGVTAHHRKSFAPVAALLEVFESIASKAP